MPKTRLGIITIKLTGKIFDDEDTENLRKHVETYLGLINAGYRLIIVAGGGGIARRYIRKARDLGVESNYWLDQIGIWASRLNALLLSSILQPHAYPHVITRVEEIPRALRISEIIILGGLIPGQSTAAVAVEAAEASGSRMIVDYTVVDKVYDKDPALYPDAKPIDLIKASELLKMLSQESLPGKYQLIDRRALELAIRSGVKIYIVNYRWPEKIRDILEGGNPGTLILPE